MAFFTNNISSEMLKCLVLNILATLLAIDELVNWHWTTKIYGNIRIINHISTMIACTKICGSAVDTTGMLFECSVDRFQASHHLLKPEGTACISVAENNQTHQALHLWSVLH